VSSPSSTNPNLAETLGGYAFAVCNSSTTDSVTISGITVRIEQVVPYTGQLNNWDGCDGGTYLAQYDTVEGGCGGGPEVDDEYLHATFAADAGSGTTVTSKQTGSAATKPDTGTHAGPLPVTIAPGHALSFNIGITPPTAPGTYTFTFGIIVNDGAPNYLVTTPATFLAPIARKWSGRACKDNPTMKSQIPASDQPARYICPEL
jgi:hypothetical protein